MIKKISAKLIAIFHETKIYWHPRLIYRRQKKIPIQQPVFMLGVQGGGLTIISRVIRLLPDTVYISGNHQFWAGEDEIHNKKRFKWLPDALTLRSPGYYNLLGHEKNHPEFGYERAFLYATQEFIDEYRLTEKDWTPELEFALKKSIRRCLCVYAKNLSTAQFHDMSQTYALKIPFLMRCFPDVRLIIVTRDPFAVCWKQAQVSPIFQKNPERAVGLAAEHWLNSYETAITDAKNGAHVLQLRFEDFMQDPIAVLKKIFIFLDKSKVDVENLIAQHKAPPLGSCEPEKWFPINGGVNKRHHHEMPIWARNVISEKCGQFAKTLGY